MKNFEEFRKAIAKRESSNNYKAVNKFNYLGAYQFGWQRLYDLGIYIKELAKLPKKENQIIISINEFLNNPKLQDKVFYYHIKQLANIINKRYKNYIGKKINNIEITLSGLVAGAHLLGLGNVSKFLRGFEVKDGFNTPISSYIKDFANYDLTELLDEK
jgi:hypothetical protein